MTTVRQGFQDRVSEITAYLDFLSAIEGVLTSGTPTIAAGTTNHELSPLQVRILYAGVYLQLYNVVEATVTLLLHATERAAVGNGGRTAAELSEEMRREWVRFVASTHEELNPENRLERALRICDHFLGIVPLQVKLSRRMGGNWDDDEIKVLVTRLGVQLTLSEAEYERIKRPVRDDKGALKLVRDVRNKLAHGLITFGECGADHTVGELRTVADTTIAYLERVLEAFDIFISSEIFLAPAIRTPAGA